MLAYVFPGQGSQYVGMGRDLYDAYPEARQVFHEADDVLCFNLSKLCFEGPEEELRDTVNAQPAILAMTAACLRALETCLGAALEAPRFLAGHSLGLFSALFHSGALEFNAALKLVRKRSEQMRSAGLMIQGGMAAIIGLNEETVSEICLEATLASTPGDAEGGRHATGVWIANHNCPGQAVISGECRALEIACNLADEKGARKVVPLAVTIPSHSPLMVPAVEGLSGVVEELDLREPEIPVIGNVSGLPLRTPDEIRDELLLQLVSPVQWTKSVRYMREQGVESFVEVGPRRILGGLIRRIDRGAQVIGIKDTETLQAFVDSLEARSAS